jgi:microcin C transport system permease protein
MPIIKNPVARKRFARFKTMKRAYFSLWLLCVLYCVSLASELLCNSTPIYVRFNGSSYFPVFKFYTENEFSGNGRKTRPDYKQLNQSPAFINNSSNYMIFPIFSYGPMEIVDPGALSTEETVRLKLTPEPFIGTVDVTRDLKVVKTLSFDFFTGNQQVQLNQDKLIKYFILPDDFESAILSRFKNQANPYSEYVVESHDGKKFQAVLSTYSPRAVAPETLRITFKEKAHSDNEALRISFDRNLKPVSKIPDLWNQIPESDTQVLLSFVKNRFDHPVDDYRINIGNLQYIVSFEKSDIRFPFPPVKNHPLGIDGAGRDVLARILYGLRISLTFGLLLVGCAMSLGIAAGALQGYYGGILDISAQRLIEIWSALPFLYIMILMGSIYGRSFILLLFCYGIFNWVGISYYIRAEFLNLRKRPFVEAAKCLGVPSYKIIFKHILPNALVPVITFFPFSLVGAIGSLAALDYLGFGLPPPTPSWGELLFQAQEYRWAWWLILYPSLALFTVMLLGVFLGEGIRNAYDPKQYSRFQ